MSGARVEPPLAEEMGLLVMVMSKGYEDMWGGLRCGEWISSAMRRRSHGD